MSFLNTPQMPKVDGYKGVQIPQMTPQQMQVLQSLLTSASPGAVKGTDYLSKLASGDQSSFEQIEAPAHTQFQKNLGQISSRFSQFGARDSSAFNNAVSGAGAEMAESLSSKRADMQQRAIAALLQQSNHLLGQRPYENALLQEDQGPDWGAILGTLGGAGLGFALSGPGGGMQGASLGAGIGGGAGKGVLR